MSILAYNCHKSRLETIEVEFTKENTTWFNNCRNPSDIYKITDINVGILISEFDYTYPLVIYDVSRADLDYNQKKARQLKRLYE